MDKRFFIFTLPAILGLCAPLAAFAALPTGFDCCRCRALSKPEFCILTPQGKPCDTVQKTLNDMLTPYKVEVECGALDAGKCSKVGSSGICPNEPVIVSNLGKSDLAQFTTAAVAAAPADKIVDVKVELGVPIPGVSFPTKLEVKDNKIIVPYLAIYVTGFQKYLLAITLIAAALMIVYGGFLYIMSSTGAKVREGKEIIKDALIGLGVAFGAVVILANINPQTSVFQPLRIDTVDRKDTPSDAVQATAMVQQAATNDQGTIVQDVQGYVAQGICPPDMVAIKHNDAYKPPAPAQNVKSFCMDRFEAPNKKGVVPFNGMYDIEADWWCASRGKRLCTIDEWQRACLGPDGKNTYGYGSTFIPGKFDAGVKGIDSSRYDPAPCNYDTPSKPGASNYLDAVHAMDPPAIKGNGYPIRSVDSILNPNNPNLQDPMYKAAFDIVTKALKELSMAEPSGKRPTCITQEGVVDMVGNVQEIVLRRGFEDKPLKERTNLSFGTTGSAKPYTWMSFYWSPVAHLGVNNSMVGVKPTCTQSWGGEHALGWRAMENGFRCCLNLNEAPPVQ